MYCCINEQIFVGVFQTEKGPSEPKKANEPVTKRQKFSQNQFTSSMKFPRYIRLKPAVESSKLDISMS